MRGLEGFEQVQVRGERVKEGEELEERDGKASFVLLLQKFCGNSAKLSLVEII